MKLILKFEENKLKEISLADRPITVGRGPDNDIHIDNLAVSTHHPHMATRGQGPSERAAE